MVYCIMSYSYQNLEIRKKSIDMSIKFYEFTKKDKFAKDFGLCNQIQRSIVSVPSNIAE